SWPAPAPAARARRGPCGRRGRRGGRWRRACAGLAEGRVHASGKWRGDGGGGRVSRQVGCLSRLKPLTQVCGIGAALTVRRPGFAAEATPTSVWYRAALTVRRPGFAAEAACVFVLP